MADQGKAMVEVPQAVQIILAIVAIIVILALVISITRLLIKLFIHINDLKEEVKKREGVDIYKGKFYFRDIPSELKLFQYQTLLSKDTVYLEYTPNLILATIMNLIDDEVLNLKVEKEKVFGVEKNQYYIYLNPDYNFLLLEPYECSILGFVFTGTPIFYVDDCINVKVNLEKRFKGITSGQIRKLQKRGAKLSNKRQFFIDEIKENDDKILGKYPSIIGILYLLLFCVLLASTLLSILFVKSVGGIFILLPFIITGGMTLIGFFSWSIISEEVDKARYTILPEYEEDLKEIKGLYNFIKDYTILKDKYPIEVHLWNKYLVFATLLGISKKINKEFRKALIEEGFNQEYINSHYPLISFARTSTSASNYFGKSLSTAFYNYEHPESSGGFSFGGGSSGSSGSGGGGGGGRRWLCRKLLII